jgi:hypothetical protein
MHQNYERKNIILEAEILISDTPMLPRSPIPLKHVRE